MSGANITRQADGTLQIDVDKQDIQSPVSIFSTFLLLYHGTGFG